MLRFHSMAGVLAALVLPPAQDDWRHLPVTPADVSPDSAGVAGIELQPSPGAIDVVMRLDRACEPKPSATYQARGAVVKIRLAAAGGRQCPKGADPAAYQARVEGLKAKRYQVLVYLPNQKKQWLAWKAGVTLVP